MFQTTFSAASSVHPPFILIKSCTNETRLLLNNHTHLCTECCSERYWELSTTPNQQIPTIKKTLIPSDLNLQHALCSSTVSNSNVLCFLSEVQTKLIRSFSQKILCIFWLLNCGLLHDLNIGNKQEQNQDLNHGHKHVSCEQLWDVLSYVVLTGWWWWFQPSVEDTALPDTMQQLWKSVFGLEQDSDCVVLQKKKKEKAAGLLIIAAHHSAVTTFYSQTLLCGSVVVETVTHSY